MTKATRLGITALMVIGGLSLGAFAGCSDDDPAPAPPADDDTGVPVETGVDSAPLDSARPDGGADTADTAPKPPDRAATLVFAAPDLGSKFICFGAFLDDPATKDEPLDTLPRTGAAGLPDPMNPMDDTKTSPFPYGAVIPVPLTDTAIAALESFNFVVYLVDANPAASMKTCKTVWKDIKADTWRWKSFPKGSVAAGEHGIITFQGCRNAATANGACGATGSNFKIDLRKADMTKPAAAGANIGLQFLHLSQFGGVGALGLPGFQSSDIYLVPGPTAASGDAGTDGGGDGGDATAPGPEFITVAENVKYDDAITTLKGFTLPAGTKNVDSKLVIATRVGGVSAKCVTSGAPTATCPNWTISLAPFFAASTGYQLVGGGLEFPNTNQLIMISGSPIEPLADGGMGIPSMRIPFGRVSSWM